MHDKLPTGIIKIVLLLNTFLYYVDTKVGVCLLCFVFKDAL